MMTKPFRVPTKTPFPPDAEALARYTLMDKAIRQSGIQINELESALGMYMVGFHFGWRILYVIHTKKTIRKYEALLDIKVSEVFEDVGPDAHRTNAYKVLDKVSNFWKFVSGDEKPPIQIDKRHVP
jgi:hypothetical protein